MSFKKGIKSFKKENNPNNKSPNEKSYIEFLFEVKNSVHAITFGQNMDSNKLTYTNIDGNNRLNAIKHFIDKPFDIFPEYLNKLFDFIDTLTILEENDKNILKDIFTNISYVNIIEMKFHKYFDIINNPKLYEDKLRFKRDEFEPIIEEIQNKLKINGIDRFDNNVKINVNLFEGYNTDELCKIFEDINKFNSQLTEIELLACRLYNINDFKIKDNIIEQSIINEITEHYKEKSENEALMCYKFENNNKINAFDFIVGFQNYCNIVYKIIEKSDNNGTSLFFKLYKNIYNSLDNTFNNQNINEFIEIITYSCNILKIIYKKTFTEQINNKLFNSTCENKFSTLTKNNLYIIISAIIGFKNKKIEEKKIINSIEICILYHFLISDIKNTHNRDTYRSNDYIQYEAGGTYIDGIAKKLLSNPSLINLEITKDSVKKLINELFQEGIKPFTRILENGNKKKEKKSRQKNKTQVPHVQPRNRLPFCVALKGMCLRGFSLTAR